MKLFVKLIFIALIILIQSNVKGQLLLNGIVEDTAASPIKFATVVAQRNETSPVIQYSIADENGRFEISIAGSFDSLLIKISSLGYETFNYWLKKDKGGMTVNGSFILHSKTIDLKEVVVHARSNVVVSGDTITFKADAYRNNTEQVVEDLLKKIPGVDVAKDGTISVNGKTIKKILIEGDDLFNNNYKLLSKNLSADVVDKIQVINKYQDNPLLKGVVNSDDKVLNITLKNNRKKILFGNCSVGAGNDGKYEVASNLISFYKKTKAFLFVNSNTIGKDPVPEINDNSGLDEELTTQQEEGYANNLVQIYRMLPQDFDKHRVNFNQAKLACLSFINKPSDKIQIKGLGYIYGDKNSLTQLNNYSYYTGSSVININENNHYSQSPVLLNGNLKLRYAPKKNELFNYTFSVTHNKISTAANIISDSSTFINNGVDNSLQVNHQFDYTNRINEKNVLLVYGKYSKLNKEQDLNLQQNPQQQLPFMELSFQNLYQSVSYPINSGKLSVKYIHGNNHNSRSIETGILIKQKSLLSGLDSLNNYDQKYLINDSFQNNLLLYQLNYFITLSNAKQLFENVNIATELSANYESVNISDKISQAFTVKKQSIFLVPKIVIKWSKGQHALSFEYAYNTKTPDVTDLYSGYVLTDYRTLNKGASFYQLINENAGSISYSFTDLDKQLSVYMNYFYSLNNGSSNSQYSLSNNYDIITRIPQFAKQQTSLYSIGLDKVIPFISSGIKLKEDVTKTNYQDEVNSDDNRNIDLLSTTTQLSLRSILKGVFNFNAGSIISYSQSKVSGSNPASAFHNSILQNFIDVDLGFSKKWTAQVSTDHYYFGAITNGKRSYFFVDCSVRFDMYHNKLSLNLSGRNLLNNKVFVNTSISDFSIQTQQYNLIPAYLLLEVNYRF